MSSLLNLLTIIPLVRQDQFAPSAPFTVSAVLWSRGAAKDSMIAEGSDRSGFPQPPACNLRNAIALLRYAMHYQMQLMLRGHLLTGPGSHDTEIPSRLNQGLAYM
ncbi:hypothetical protein CERZMDRAFT_101651 [Cercospora zeae-maydis SCOH1-5]|uniref:Uncharacterized protein n=1 Tax=Cercospora zeae-maydis SCOH1-5 TaxID=717836 RepID=A0A6A6F4P1_9PEZI|nr:hypothetical protein CERZMDRAFT_101651 [Cercospora zeae-maydis SCOH1-5]